MVVVIGAINSIRAQSIFASRLQELALERSIAVVDKDEATNAAYQSDVVKLASKDEDKSQVPFSVYLQRAARFSAKVKKKKETQANEKPECPIERARAESATGENAPLNWLVADHFGGDPEGFPGLGDQMASEPLLLTADSTFESQPKVASHPQSLLADEWLLSPCA